MKAAAKLNNLTLNNTGLKPLNDMIRSSLSLFFIFILFFSIKANALDNVKTQALAELIVHQQYQFPAQVMALNNITISSEMSGIIISQSHLVGTMVNKGQTLVRLDCTDNELAKEQGISALKRLQIQTKLDQQQLTRARQLVRVKSISKQELDQKQTALDASIASLEQQNVALKIIDRNITKCTIKAPFTGLITDNNAQLGSYTTPGLALVTLLDPNNVEIKMGLPTNLVTTLKDINNIKFKQNNVHYAVSIRAVMPMVDRMTKQQMIRLTINHAKKPLANSMGKIQWQGQQAYLPSQYIVQRNGELGLFIAESNKAIFKPLEQAIEGQNSPINLSPNTLVITNKLLLLKDKDLIN